MVHVTSTYQPLLEIHVNNSQGEDEIIGIMNNTLHSQPSVPNSTPVESSNQSSLPVEIFSHKIYIDLIFQ